MSITVKGEGLVCPLGTEGRFATLKARASKAGFTLDQTLIDGRIAFVVSRWSMSRTLPDLVAVGTFLDRVGNGR